ncbi:hypothetical protein BY458DRAFT_452947 [Sporodiniella umbellata]|nr:hypothetical protein BY458DRAFT_452947 [Sporodiniella umbellata]
MENNQKINLPSIQSVLNNVSLNKTITSNKGHRRYASEQLDAFRKAPLKNMYRLDRFKNEEGSFENNLSSTTNNDTLHKPFSLHARSFSDYTHPYSSLPIHQDTSTAKPSLYSLTPEHTDQPADASNDWSSEVCVSEILKKKNDSHPKRSPATKCHVCVYCRKAFSRPSSLRTHVYSHTGERPFECPQPCCFRKFSVHSNMRRHLRVHESGKPLKRKENILAPIINPLASKKV